MGRPKKEIVAPPPPPSQEKIEEDGLGLESASLEERALAVLTPKQVKNLKKIAYYTAKVGLPLSESCQLLDIDYEKFQEEMKLEPLIEKIIKAKELEYKKDLLYTLSQKARSGDDKLAQWLLERKYPGEYGEKKAPKGDDGSGDIFLEAFRFIRKNGDSAPLIESGSGIAVTVRPKEEGEKLQTLPARIEDILNNTV